MQTTAIILVILSAFIHPQWNLLSKRGQATAAFFLVSTLAVLPFAIGLVVTNRVLLSDLPPAAWGLVALTGCAQALYYSGLAAAYRHGDLSLAYPLVRALPVLMVAGASLLLGRGQMISFLGLGGFGLIATGCFLQPLSRFADWHPRLYLTPCCGFAVLAALGTTGYTLIDDAALRLLGEKTGAGSVQISLLYIGMLSISTAVVMSLVVGASATGRTQCRDLLKRGWPTAAGAGIAIAFTYGLVVLAMNFARDVSYIMAFRQLSIPIGAILGVLVLGESVPTPRRWGIVLIVAGLILTALY